jgi:prepilin peptidase CpaA
MEIFAFQKIIFMLTSLVVVGAMGYDFKWRRIPNFITFPAMILGFTIHTLHAGWQGFFLSLGGLAIGGGIFLLFYIAGGMGAGDVKMIGGVGALLGTPKIFMVLFLTVFIGGLMAVYTIVGSLVSKKRSKNNFVKDNGSSSEISPLKEPIPYGLAIGTGTLITMML